MKKFSKKKFDEMMKNLDQLIVLETKKLELLKLHKKALIKELSPK